MFCKLKVIFQSPFKPNSLFSYSLLNLKLFPNLHSSLICCSVIKIPFRKRSALTLLTDICVVTARLLIMVKYASTFLVNSIESNLKFCKLKVIFQSPFKPNSLFRYKDSPQKKICSDIVYRYMCGTYKVTYYGKTYRHFFSELYTK